MPWQTLLAVGDPAPLLAGMPSITLSDVARMRVQTISFFLAGFLLASWGVQLIWNRLRADWPVLPRLSYGKALAAVTLWGLLFILILTMISGARELMTPGAWEKRGFTYRLADDPAAPPSPDKEAVRRQKLEHLRHALWEYANAHEGQFPPDRSAGAIAAEAWQVADASGMQYLYVGGQTAGRGVIPLAYEPELYGPRRLVLFTNGEIRSAEIGEIVWALPGEGRR